MNVFTDWNIRRKMYSSFVFRARIIGVIDTQLAPHLFPVFIICICSCFFDVITDLKQALNCEIVRRLLWFKQAKCGITLSYHSFHSGLQATIVSL